MKRKVKNILLRWKLEGRGIVNYDDKKQTLAFWNKGKPVDGLNHLIDLNDNVSYAKKNIYENIVINDKGEEVKAANYKIAISSQCLKSAIFPDEGYNSSINSNKDLKLMYYATPEMLVRGFMTTISGGAGEKKKSCLNLSYAEQTNDAKSVLGFHSRRSEKETGDKDKSGITLHKKEEVGEITYMSEGDIDIQSMQFLSFDLLYDRQMINPDDFEKFKYFLKSKLPSFNSDINYFTLNSGSDKTPEYGCLLSNDDINFLVRRILEMMMEAQVKRTHAFAKTSKLEYKLVYDPIDDVFDKENGWVSLEKRKDIEDFECDFEIFYSEADEKISKELREAMKVYAEKEDKSESKKTKSKKK